MNIKPCPFCGSDKIATEQSSRVRYGDNVDKFTSYRFQIACRSCGCQTGFRLHMDDALVAWNRRSDND